MSTPYFQKVLTDAEAQARLPITLDAQAGLAYSTMLQANPRQVHAAALNPVEVVNAVFQRVDQHPAATQETRTRVAKLAAQLDVPQVWPRAPRLALSPSQWYTDATSLLHVATSLHPLRAHQASNDYEAHKCLH